LGPDSGRRKKDKMLDRDTLQKLLEPLFPA